MIPGRLVDHLGLGAPSARSVCHLTSGNGVPVGTGRNAGGAPPPVRRHPDLGSGIRHGDGEASHVKAETHPVRRHPAPCGGLWWIGRL